MNKKEVPNECVWVVQLTADRIKKRLVSLQVDNYVVCEMNMAKKLKNLLSDLQLFLFLADKYAYIYSAYMYLFGNQYLVNSNQYPLTNW